MHRVDVWAEAASVGERELNAENFSQIYVRFTESFALRKRMADDPFGRFVAGVLSISDIRGYPYAPSRRRVSRCRPERWARYRNVRCRSRPAGACAGLHEGPHDCSV